MSTSSSAAVCAIMLWMGAWLTAADIIQAGLKSNLSLQGILADVELLQEITMASREAVGAFVQDRTDKDGRVSGSALKNFARLANFDREPYMKALEVRVDVPCQGFTLAAGWPLRESGHLRGRGSGKPAAALQGGL